MREEGGSPSERADGPLVIGLGNEHRGDDAFGLLVARRLAPRLRGLGTVVEGNGDGTELLDLWRGREHVWIVDAIRSGGSPGEVYRIEVGPKRLPSPLTVTSSHGVSLAQAVALGQALRRLPRHLVMVGVEPAGFGTGEPLSSPVGRAVGPVVRQVEREVRKVARSALAHAPREGPHA